MNVSRILLVEDNESDILLTRRAISKNRLQIDLVVAEDGQEALDFLMGPSDIPDPMPALILLDINLPLVNGLEVLRRIRLDPRTRRLPVVILTSSGQVSDLAACYDLGANSYIRKPVDFLEFNECIQQLVKFWLEMNVRPPAIEG